MELEINGKKETLTAPLSLQEYLEGHGILVGRIACELNGKIIRRKDLSATPLQAGDRLEIITIVGGG